MFKQPFYTKLFEFYENLIYDLSKLTPRYNPSIILILNNTQNFKNDKKSILFETKLLHLCTTCESYPSSAKRYLNNT